MFTHGSASLQLFPLVWILLRSLGVICYDRWFLSEVHKSYFKDWCLMNSQPAFLFLTSLNLMIMVILSKACKSHNSLKLSFMNIWGLCSNFVDCESFLESNSPYILVLCETNLDDSIDSGNFSVRGYLPLIWKDSSTHIHGRAVYVEEGLPFARDLSRKFCRFLLMFSTGFMSLSIILLFPLLIIFVFVHGFWFYFI